MACMHAWSDIQLCLSNSLWPHGLCSLPGSFVLGIPQARVGGYFLLQGIFLTQESNPALLQEQMDSLPLHHLGSPKYYGKKQKNI